MSRTTTRKSGAERREEIARAALHILGHSGLSGITIAALAEAVGLTPGALFRHFTGRTAILEEAIRLAEVRVEATFPDGSLPALERLRRLAHARVKLLSEEPAIAWLLRSEQVRKRLPAAAVRRLRRLVRRSRSYIREALDEAIAQGQLRRDVSSDVLLLIYTSTVHALIGQRGVHARDRLHPQPAAAIDDLLTLIARGETEKSRR